MRRTLMCASLMAAVALSATALAGTHGYRDYKGSVKFGPGKVHFSANVQRKRVRSFRIVNVNLTCEQGTVKFSHQMRPRQKHLQRIEGGSLIFRFVDRIENGGSHLKVFVGGLIKSRHYRTAVGNIHTQGDLDPNHTKCKRVNGRSPAQGAQWRAHRR